MVNRGEGREDSRERSADGDGEGISTSPGVGVQLSVGTGGPCNDQEGQVKLKGKRKSAQRPAIKSNSALMTLVSRWSRREVIQAKKGVGG